MLGGDKAGARALFLFTRGTKAHLLLLFSFRSFNVLSNIVSPVWTSVSKMSASSTSFSIPIASTIV